MKYQEEIKNSPQVLKPLCGRNCVRSYNESQRGALFLIFIWQSTLHVSDRSTVHHQEYLKTVYTQYVYVMLVMLTVC